LEVINQIQKVILNNFGQILDSEHFYLTGGTALSLFYLRHRRSNDLDFFTTMEDIILPFSYRLEEKLKSKGMSTQRQRGIHSFVELLVKGEEETTIVHLAIDTPFRLESTKEFFEYPKLKVDSLVDIASNKLLALFGRATLRDFIDIYSLIKKKNFTPEELMEKAKRKDPGFDLYWLGVALERINIFKDDSPEMLLLVEPIKFKDLATFFNQWRKKIAKEFKT
jgi:predicted nucleotidyltransferase component of viral defense system